MIPMNGGFRTMQPVQQRSQSKPKKEKKKQVRMSVSFKDDELWLHEEIYKHSCPGGWVKDILKDYYQNKKGSPTLESEKAALFATSHK